MFLTTILGFLWLGIVAGNRNSPPSAVCDSMSPGHGDPAMTTPAPYSISFSKNTYTANEQITVTLSGNTASDTFRGFLIEPRTDVNTYATVGTIPNFPAKTRNPCSDSGNTAISHTEPPPDPITDKTSISFTWTAPASDVGPIIFVYTIVKTKPVYWVKLQSAPLTFASGTNGGSSSVGPTSTEASTDDPSTLPNIAPYSEPVALFMKFPTCVYGNNNLNAQVINWDPKCGTTLGCYRSPADCLINCDYLVTWKPVDDTDVEFTMKRRVLQGDKYIAIAFSDDMEMGNDSVVECDSLNGNVMVQVSYNPPETDPMPASNRNKMLDTSSYGITDAQTSHADSILSCTFKRKISYTSGSAPARKKRVAVDGTTFFDLSTPWHLLVAVGDMNSGTSSKVKHTQAKRSSEKIDFLTVGDPSGSTPSPIAPGDICKMRSECTKSIGCMHDCDGAATFFVSWKEVGDVIEMSIICKQSANNRYCAIGLSNDDKMGSDSVIECSTVGTTVQVTVSYNDGRINSRLTDPTLGITPISGAYQDGVLSCYFTRAKTFALASPSSGRRKRATAAASTYFDMNSDFIILFAQGPAGAGYVGQHDSQPQKSSQKANFQALQDLGATESKKVLVTVHAILMTIAWLMLVSIGVVLPRHYKEAWREDSKLCGLAIWFQLHRFCMVLCWLSSAAAFVVIFVHVGGYADISGSNFNKAHPIMGIVVMALATINPIMALFRCHPGTPKRPVFNAFHSLVGVAAHTIGIVNIFAGVTIPGLDIPDYLLIILYCFCGWIVFFEIVMFVHARIYQQGPRSESYELKGSAESSSALAPSSSKQSGFKVAAFYIHVLVLIGLCAAVSVIVGLKLLKGQGGDDDHDHDD